MDRGVVLRWYKRKDVQDAIVEHVRDREVAIRFDTYFGKRPDMFNYPRDILEAAIKGATSFHASEERWVNPLEISSNLRKKELDALRIGWDLILDIDCPHWELSKTLAALFIRALQDHGVESISVKFSGNKGFHIAVPFEAFPRNVGGRKLEELFPEAPKRIAFYLIYYLKRYIEVKEGKVSFSDLFSVDLGEVQSLSKKPVITQVCDDCSQIIEGGNVEQVYDVLCKKCNHKEEAKEKVRNCSKCKSMSIEVLRKSSSRCVHAKTTATFNPETLIDLDTVLISSRHLYRIPYSLHEKSGLASIPIPLNEVMSFEKEQAKPDGLVFAGGVFVSRDAKPGEARQLLLNALDFTVEEEKTTFKEKEYELPSEAIPVDCFPPCIQQMLKGLVDGRKRALFVLINFLKSSGWKQEDMEKFLREWNERNPEQLKEGYLMGQIRYAKGKQPLPPPNFSRKEYYEDIACGQHDNLCKKVKNPLQYAKRKWKYRVKEKKEDKKEESK